MKHPRVSLFASAIRTKFFGSFLRSIESSTIMLEIVFAGLRTRADLKLHGLDNYVEENNVIFKYIHTGDIKPAQCYEIARQACTGELIHWTADDCEYQPDCMALAYDFWNLQNNRKAIVSIQSKENNVMCDMRLHSFFGFRPETPRMAPLGLMNREYLNELGGLDRRYICGQYENDIVMRAYQDGAKVVQFDKSYVEIDHRVKHGVGNARPFALGYPHDRRILEESWTKGNGEVVKVRKDPFDPYSDEDILTKSQSYSKSFWD